MKPGRKLIYLLRVPEKFPSDSEMRKFRNITFILTGYLNISQNLHTIISTTFH